MSADEAEKIAADWLARQDRGLTAEESDRMELWLEQSSLNRVAYLRLKSAWQRADRLAALKMILSGQLASEAQVQRFHTEAEAVALLLNVALLLLPFHTERWISEHVVKSPFLTIGGRNRLS